MVTRTGGAPSAGQARLPGELAGLDPSSQTAQTASVEAPATPEQAPDREALRRAHETLGGREVRASAAPGRSPQQALLQLRADLNRSLFDGSPFIITDAEVRSAHATLLAAPAGQLSGILAALDDVMLNRYLKKLAEVEPFRLDLAKGEKASPSALAAFATRVAEELTPEVGRTFVARLDDTGRRRFLEGVLQLPTGAHVERLRAALGAEAFATLARGGKPESLAGGGLIAGKLWRENVTLSFQERYAAAKSGDLPLPAGAAETLFFMGPGLFGDQLPGYLEPNRRALAEWGVPQENIQKLRYNTADDPAKNADDIYAQLEAAYRRTGGKQKIVVLGHSKFGRDMLEAFRRHPDLRNIVSGAVMMQPALTAPIAQDLGRRVMENLLNPVLALVGGDRRAFNGLSEKLEELPPWPKDVPTVTMASSTESPKALLQMLSGPYYEKVYNVASDGAVAYQDQVALDGSYLVSLPGVADHAHAGLTFTDACEHFAVQIDAGAPDEVVRGMLDRLGRMVLQRGALDAVIALWKAGHDTPAERARCSAELRTLGPALDRFSHAINERVGRPLIDVVPMTQALVSELLSRGA